MVKRNANRRSNKSRQQMGRSGEDGMGIVNVPRLLKRGDAVQHKAVRTHQLAQIDTNGATDVLYGTYFRLADLDNVTQFTNLYDEYKIEAIEISLVSNITFIPTTGGGNQNSHCCTVHTAIDYDDGAAPANKAALLSYETYKLHGAMTPGRVYTRKFVPAVRMGTYDSTPAYGSGAVRQLQWLDTASPNVEHFGIKIGLFNGDSNLNASYFLYCTYWLAFRKII